MGRTSAGREPDGVGCDRPIDGAARIPTQVNHDAVAPIDPVMPILLPCLLLRRPTGLMEPYRHGPAETAPIAAGEGALKLALDDLLEPQAGYRALRRAVELDHPRQTGKVGVSQKFFR